MSFASWMMSWRRASNREAPPWNAKAIMSPISQKTAPSMAPRPGRAARRDRQRRRVSVEREGVVEGAAAERRALRRERLVGAGRQAAVVESQASHRGQLQDPAFPWGAGEAHVRMKAERQRDRTFRA